MDRITASKIILHILSVLGCYFFYTKIVDPMTIKDCGIITYKGTTDQVTKHSSSVKFVLVTNGEDHWVSAASWSTHKVGDNICFESPDRGSFIFIVWGVISLFVMICTFYYVMVNLACRVYCWIYRKDFETTWTSDF